MTEKLPTHPAPVCSSHAEATCLCDLNLPLRPSLALTTQLAVALSLARVPSTRPPPPTRPCIATCLFALNSPLRPHQPSRPHSPSSLSPHSASPPCKALHRIALKHAKDTGWLDYKEQLFTKELDVGVYSGTSSHTQADSEFAGCCD